jgi:hypothetical protein
VPKSVQRLLEADWREGLFTLAADKTQIADSPALRFWQSAAGDLLTRVCHLPAEMRVREVTLPSESDCAGWILTAPPMPGGEYLTPEVMSGFFREMVEWCDATAHADSGLAPFLEKRAPRWRQVGRVCFHLAENKNSDDHPFAFMATFVSGLGASGQARHLPLRRALEQSADANNRPALIKLLSPVHAASERCEWVKALVDSGDIYRPMAWVPDRAYQLLVSVPALEESGLTVRVPDWWRQRARPRVAVTVGSKQPSIFGADAVLDFNVAVALGDENLSEEEIAELLRGGDGLVMLKGQWVEVDRERLREAIEHWEDLRRAAPNGEISFIEGMRMLAGASRDLRDERRAQVVREWAHVDAGAALREILASLRDPARLDPTDDGGMLKTALRPYQAHGVRWLRLLGGLGLGACLADDMGLGKTVQVLALLLCVKASDDAGADHRPALLVVPASLLGNWRAEAQRFAPALRVVFLHPAETTRETLDEIEQNPGAHLPQADLVVTTYSMVTRQLPWLSGIPWRLMILDEAQAIKNSGTRQSKAVRQITATARIVLTGTPVENHLGDLWSIFDFLNPGLLGSAAVFKQFTKKLESQDADRFAPLRRLVAPYILRRMKTDRSVAPDLPDKVETTAFCSLTRAQVRVYEQIVQAMKESLQEAEGIQRRGLVLQTLMRLKQVCNHPSQMTGDGAFAPDDSGKFQRLAQICDELAGRQQRVLVFTQFREIIDPLASHLASVFGRPGLVLHGQTAVKSRKSLVERFQDEDGPPFFILSLKAGGTGLNLTAASHVIHFDRWWNPAVEDQATDRAFRIGQKSHVMVHKFVTTGTLEERIDTMIADKRRMAAEIISGGGEVDLTSLKDDELLDLVRLDITRATE